MKTSTTPIQNASTPRPWHKEGPIARDGKRWGNHIAIVGPNNSCIIVQYNSETWDADAELILWAVNSHEQLVEALKEAHAALQDIIDECPTPKLPYGVKIVEIARNALAAHQARQHLAPTKEIQGIEAAQ